MMASPLDREDEGNWNCQQEREREGVTLTLTGQKGSPDFE